MSERLNLTHVRDAVAAHFATMAAVDTWQTVHEIAASTGKQEDAVASAVYELAKRDYLVRRMKIGSNAYEYAQGKHFARLAKYEGKKFPSHGGHKFIAGKETVKKSGMIPAVTGGIGIVVKIDGVAHAITLKDARTIYTELRELFERPYEKA